MKKLLSLFILLNFTKAHADDTCRIYRCFKDTSQEEMAGWQVLNKSGRVLIERRYYDVYNDDGSRKGPGYVHWELNIKLYESDTLLVAAFRIDEGSDKQDTAHLADLAYLGDTITINRYTYKGLIQDTLEKRYYYYDDQKCLLKDIDYSWDYDMPCDADAFFGPRHWRHEVTNYDYGVNGLKTSSLTASEYLDCKRYKKSTFIYDNSNRLISDEAKGTRVKERPREGDWGVYYKTTYSYPVDGIVYSHHGGMPCVVLDSCTTKYSYDKTGRIIEQTNIPLYEGNSPLSFDWFTLFSPDEYSFYRCYYSYGAYKRIAQIDYFNSETGDLVASYRFDYDKP